MARPQFVHIAMKNSHAKLGVSILKNHDANSEAELFLLSLGPARKVD